MAANLQTTDTADLGGVHLEQSLERLTLALDTGRLTVHRDAAGAVRLRIEAGGQRIDVALPPQAAGRLGAHAQALAVASMGSE